VRRNEKSGEKKRKWMIARKEPDGNGRKRRKRDAIWPELGFKIFRF
jgi:hypothetical protein